jgi:hypothetical protein
MMDTTKPDFIKAAIYIAFEGEQAGQYIASCAKNLCGYTGESRCASHWRWTLSNLYKSASRETLQQARAYKELLASRSVRLAHMESLSNPS